MSEREIADIDTATDTTTADTQDYTSSHDEEDANDTIATALHDDIPDVADLVREKEENTEDGNTSQLVDKPVNRGDKDPPKKITMDKN